MADIRPLDYIVGKAQEMVDNDRDLRKMLDAMDNMAHNIWKLPEGLEIKDWIRPVINDAPSNALNAAVKVLSVERPKIRLLPLSPSPADKRNANIIERVLRWELTGADKRGDTRIVPDIIRSSLRYDIVCINLVYLPWQMKVLEKLQPDSARYKRALRAGKYAINVYNPKNVHYRYSPLGLEAVVLAQATTAEAVAAYWGERAVRLREMLIERGKDFDVVLYDYTDHDQRTVWWVEGKDDSVVTAGAENVIINEARTVPFIPWVIRRGGTSLDAERQYQLKPLLEHVYRTGQWELINIIDTIITSETATYAAAPRWLVEGPDGSLQVDYGDPAKIAKARPGTKVTQLDPPRIDQALLHLLDRTVAKINASTQIQVLQNLNFPAGTAYASINAVLQTVLSSLAPFKRTAEAALEDTLEQMLLWIDFTGDELYAFGTGKDDYGMQYAVDKTMFDPEHIYFNVELNASAPTDRQQRINAGAMLLQMGVSRETVFGDLGFEDVEYEITQRMQEDLLQAEFQSALQEIMAARAQAMQAQMQGAQSAAVGPGFNPAAGGQPPAMANPEATFEGQTGTTRAGEPIAGQ